MTILLILLFGVSRNLIQQNSKFFLEVLATDKSNTLEWIIIALISIEIVVMGVEIARGI